MSRTLIVAALAACAVGQMVRADGGAVASSPLGGIGICLDEEQCTEPCPASGACFVDYDCGGDLICVPPMEPPDYLCLPSFCGCDPIGDGWACTQDCAGKCVPEVPAVSEWGIVCLGLLLLTAGSVVLRGLGDHCGAPWTHNARLPLTNGGKSA